MRMEHLPIVVTGHPRANGPVLPARETDRFVLEPCVPGTLAMAFVPTR
jgi:hypothetical protein